MTNIVLPVPGNYAFPVLGLQYFMQSSSGYYLGGNATHDNVNVNVKVNPSYDEDCFIFFSVIDNNDTYFVLLFGGRNLEDNGSQVVLSSIRPKQNYGSFWKLESTKDGYITLKNFNTGKYLALNDASEVITTMKPPDNNNNLKWIFIPTRYELKAEMHDFYFYASLAPPEKISTDYVAEQEFSPKEIEKEMIINKPIKKSMIDTFYFKFNQNIKSTMKLEITTTLPEGDITYPVDKMIPKFDSDKGQWSISKLVSFSEPWNITIPADTTNPPNRHFIVALCAPMEEKRIPFAAKVKFTAYSGLSSNILQYLINYEQFQGDFIKKEDNQDKAGFIEYSITGIMTSRYVGKFTTTIIPFNKS